MLIPQTSPIGCFRKDFRIDQTDHVEVQSLCEHSLLELNALWLKGLVPCSYSRRRAQYTEYKQWLEEVQQGTHAAFASLMLHLVPNLERLSLRVPEPWDMFAKSCTPCPVLFPHNLVAGFQKLKFLNLNFLPPWEILNKPILSTFCFDSTTMDYYAQIENVDSHNAMQHSQIPDGATNTNLVSLIFVISIRMLIDMWYNDYKSLFCGTSVELQKHITTLRFIQLRLTCQEDELRPTEVQNETRV
jgi:hypothetical protein